MAVTRVTQAGLQVDVSSDEVRVTQAGLQVDARFNRVEGTNNCWEFHVTDRIGIYLAFLDGAFDKAYLSQLNGVGGGAFSIHIDDAKATQANLAVGNIVVVRYRNVDVGAWIIEHVEERLVEEGEEAAKIYRVAGRGLLATLEWGLVYPGDTTNRDNVERTFRWSKAATFLTLYNEFVLRCGGCLTPDFTSIKDSRLSNWTDQQLVNFRAGQSLLEVAGRLSALGGIDFTVDADRTLHAWISAGSATSVIFREGKDVLGAAKNQQAGELANVVLGEGEDLYVETADATSIGTYGRRESMLTARNIGGAAAISAANAALIDQYGDPLISYRLEVSTEDAHPFIDYDIGDTVRLEIPGRVAESFRVLGLGVRERSGPCDLVVSLEVNWVDVSYLARQKNIQAGTLESVGSRTGAGALIAATEASLIRYIIDYAMPNLLTDDAGNVITDDIGNVIFGDL